MFLDQLIGRVQRLAEHEFRQALVGVGGRSLQLLLGEGVETNVHTFLFYGFGVSLADWKEVIYYTSMYAGTAEPWGVHRNRRWLTCCCESLVVRRSCAGCRRLSQNGRLAGDSYYFARKF